MYTVRELPLAKQDKRTIFAWLDAYDDMVEKLKRDAATFGQAPERKDSDIDVRQALFKTRRGRVYLALFFIEDDDIFILRVRGPGQAQVLPGEIR